MEILGEMLDCLVEDTDNRVGDTDGEQPVADYSRRPPQWTPGCEVGYS